MIQKLSMVTRVVTDQDEALEFYARKCGFEVVRDHEGPHGRFLTVAPAGTESAELVLVTPDGFDEETAEELAALVGNDAGLIYAVDDCQETYRELAENGVTFQGEPEEMPWGVQVVALDPDGNEIVFQEPVASGSF